MFAAAGAPVVAPSGKSVGAQLMDMADKAAVARRAYEEEMEALRTGHLPKWDFKPDEIDAVLPQGVTPLNFRANIERLSGTHVCARARARRGRTLSLRVRVFIPCGNATSKTTASNGRWTRSRRRSRRTRCCHIAKT